MGLFGKPSAEKIEQIYQKGHNAREAKDYYLAGFNLRKAGDQGHVGAMMENAWMHYNGEMGEPRYMTALEWFEKAAEQGDPEGMYMCGLMYFLGEGTEKDDAKALPWLEKAAELGDRRAMLPAGVILTKGGRVPADLERAFHWMKGAAEGGDTRAVLNLAVMYDSGMGTAVDVAKAFALYQQLAEQGVVEAQLRTGDAFYAGTGVEKDIQQAISWYERAAEQSEPEAMYKLGCLYLAGECTDRTIGYCLDNAQYWFHAAAEHGYKDAGEQEEKVKGLLSGLKSYAFLVSSKHTAWMEKMAENGNGHACYNVGRFRVQEHNYEEAFALFSRGAATGNGNCAYECGVCCRDGLGTEKDRDKAVQWFRRAVEAGSMGNAEEALKLLGEEV